MKKPIYLIIISSLLINACQKAPTSQIELESDNFDDISNQFDKGEEVKLSRRQIASGTQSQRGIISANAVSGSSRSRYSNYGYSPSINTLLGFADYMHWKDPSLVSIAKIMVGKNAFVPSPTTQPAAYCGKWNLTITSNQTEKILLGMTDQGFGQATQTDSTHISLSWRSGQKLFTGIIIGIKESAVDEGCLEPLPTDAFIDRFDPFAVAMNPYIRRNQNYTRWYGDNDPYSHGYSGDVNGYYYAYPPALCAARHSTPLQLRVTGSVSNCDGSDSKSVDINLDALVNDGTGYAPRLVKTFGTGEKHRFLARAVNYNGADWYQPPQDNWIYPGYQNSCSAVKARIDAARTIASQCTANSDCTPDYAISEECKPSFVKNNNSDVISLIQMLDYYQRYCPQPLSAVVCTAQAYTSTACVQNRCTWR